MYHASTTMATPIPGTIVRKTNIGTRFTRADATLIQMAAGNAPYIRTRPTPSNQPKVKMSENPVMSKTSLTAGFALTIFIDLPDIFFCEERRTRSPAEEM